MSGYSESNGRLELLASAFAKGATTLRLALNEYWPWEAMSGIDQSNMMVHVAFALREMGFLAYSEIACGERGQRIDLFAFNLSKGIGTRIEFDVIDSVTSSARKIVRKLAKDWARLLSANLPREHSSPPTGLHCFAALVVSCWNREVHSWWNNHGRGSPPDKRKHHDAWSGLQTALQIADAVGTMDIKRTDRLAHDHWLLYLVKGCGVDVWYDEHRNAANNPRY